MSIAFPSPSSRPGLKTGFWASVIVAILGAIYLVLLALSSITSGLPPREPYLTLLNILVLICGPALVFWSICIYEICPIEQRIFGMSSVVLMGLFAAMTGINRFVALTVVRQSTSTENLALIMPYGWPSVMLALEILGWGFFMGLAIIAAAFIFRGSRLQSVIFWTMLVSGILCVSAAVTMIAGNMNLMLLGAIGWGPGLTLAAILTAIFFRKLENGIIQKRIVDE